jgi:hypothetical protein
MVNSNGAPQDELLDPGSVLAAAFACHDFLGQLRQREVHIQTSEPFFEGNAAYIRVDAMIDSLDRGVSYRYRIEFDGVNH